MLALKINRKMGSAMKLSKKLFLIITIVVLMGSMRLIFAFTSTVIHNEKNNINILNETKKLEPNSSKIILTPEESNKLTVSDSLKIEEKIDESVSAFEVYNGKIPILMYHSVSYEKGNILRVSKENFRVQMKYLKDNNYTTLTIDELYSYMQTGRLLPKKPIVITFDDGYKDNYTNAYPILKEFGLKATVFIITSTIDVEKDFLTSNEIKIMDSNNIRIESHTVAHEKLDKTSYKDSIKTLTTSKVKLEKILNRKINYIAYPYGVYNENTIKAVKESGYKLAFSTEFGFIDKNNNIYSLGRIFVNSNFTLEQFKAKLIYKK